MENLLFEILKSPTDLNIKKVEVLLDTPEGIEMFVTQLINNNVIAFTYMKMQAKDWVLNPIRQDFILKYKNTFYNLVLSTTDQNLNLLSDFFEILFFNYLYWPDFLDFLIQLSLTDKSHNDKSYNDKSHNDKSHTDKSHNERALGILNSLFYKFRKLSKSDKLFSEIILCINKTKEIFKKYFFTINKDVDKDVNYNPLLNIFYSLVYQDIHPFFEENIDSLISALSFLFKRKELQSLICEIYNLFILKYPDLIDFTKILGSILISIDSFDYIKYSVILNIIKKRNTELVKFEDVLINAIRLGSVLSNKEMDEMEDIEYSKNILNNIDIYRGILIDILFNIRNKDFYYKLLRSPLTEESEIFLYTALKLRSDSIIKKCQIIINNINSEKYLSFSAFRYLLTIKEYSTCDIKYIRRGHVSAYLCIEMVNRHLEKTSPIENNILRILTGDTFINHQEDQYSLNLLSRIIKEDVKYMTKDIYRWLIQYTLDNIRNINSPLAFSYIFDIFGILMSHSEKDSTSINLYEKDFTSINLYEKDSSYLNVYEKDFTNLINIITSEEIVEMYYSGFYLLSIIILHSKSDYSSVLTIISQEKIWSSKELILSVICLTISLYKRNYMSQEQINYIIQYLNHKHYINILSSNTINNRVDDDIEEYFITQSLIINENYPLIYKNMIEYCTGNYISKKNVRRVVRAFIRGSKVVQDSMYRNIIEKNKFNLGYDNVPYSVYINFDI